MMLKFTYLILFTVLSVGAFAQTDDKDEYVLEGDEYVVPFDSLTVKDKMHYSFGMGVGFGELRYGNYFSTYYKPMVSYDVSPKFSITTGLMYVNSSVNNVPVISENRYQLFSGNISQYYAFVGGEYKLTDRLSVGGSVFYDFTSYKMPDGTALNTSSGLDNLGYSAYVNYKVTKNLTFGAEIRMNDKNPYRQNSNTSMDNFFIGNDNSFIRQR